MKICFVALYAYPVFKPSAATAFGGSEVRAWLLATGLARNPAHAVSVVVFDHGQPGVERIGEVTVHAHPYYRPGGRTSSRWPPVSKYLTPAPRFPFCTVRRVEPAMAIELPVALARRLALGTAGAARRLIAPPLRLGQYEAGRETTRVYERIDADVYCVFGVSELAAQVAAYCRAFRKKLVLLANSDENFAPDHAPSHGDLHREVIAAADAIVTQNVYQRQWLKQRFGRDSVTIRNPVDLAGARAPVAHDGAIALWIGRSDPIKQPEALVALARALPDVRFVMVMNRADAGIFERVAREKPANVELLERVEYRETDRLFARAFALVNTSAYEGFPNTFLQAGKHGVPILSLNADPDGFIARHGCGFVAAGDAGALAQRLRTLRDERDTWAACSASVQRYTETHHGLEERVAELDALLARAVGTGA